MPAKRKKENKSTSTISFLHFPLEVRQLIYEFCYAWPHPQESLDLFDAPDKQVEAQLNRKNRQLKKQAAIPVVQTKIITKCTFPRSHLSLGSVCRQVRNEWFPIFAREHVFSIPNPLAFANEYLSYNPPHRYSNIRHLAIDWRPLSSECKCEVTLVAPCQFHPVRYPPVSRDLQNLLKLPDTYPELFNSIESIRLKLLPDSSGDKFPFDDYVSMFKHAILLVEKMDYIRRRDVPTLNEQKYILAVQTGQSRSYPTWLGIFAVTDAIWDSLVDESWLQPKTGWVGSEYVSTKSAALLDWANIDGFTSAVQSGRLYCRPTQRYPHNIHQEEVSSEFTIVEVRQNVKRNWKVVFDNPAPPRAWHLAISELYGKKGRKPPPNLEGHDGEFYSLD